MNYNRRTACDRSRPARARHFPAGTIVPLPPIVQVAGADRMSVADIGVPQQPSVDKTFGHTLPSRLEGVRPTSSCARSPPIASVSVEQWDNSGGAHRVPAFAPNGSVQPLQPCRPVAAPVQPGIPGGRHARRSCRLCRRPLLLRREGRATTPRRPAATSWNADRHRLHDQRSDADHPRAVARSTAPAPPTPRAMPSMAR